MAPQHHTSTFACRAVGENKPQKMNDFRRESFLLTHASTSRLSGFRVAKATRNLPAIRWLYVIYQYIRWVKKSTSFQFCAANLQKLFQTTIIPPPHFQIFLPPLTPPHASLQVNASRSAVIKNVGGFDSVHIFLSEGMNELIHSVGAGLSCAL